MKIARWGILIAGVAMLQGCSGGDSGGGAEEEQRVNGLQAERSFTLPPT